MRTKDKRFFEAIEKKNLENIHRLLKGKLWGRLKGANINAIDESDNGKTPLHAAARGGDMDIVRILIEQGADPNAGDSTGRTPIYWAIEMGHAELVAFLLSKGAEINHFAPKRKATPLMEAVQKSRYEIAELLVNCGASVSREPVNPPHTDLKQYVSTSLMIALSRGDRRLTELVVNAWKAELIGCLKQVQGGSISKTEASRLVILLQYPNNTNVDNTLPLIKATELGWMDIVVELVEHGAKIDGVGWFLNGRGGQTYSSALMCAVMRNQVNIAAYLVSKGANKRVTDSYHRTPLDFAWSDEMRALL